MLTLSAGAEHEFSCDGEEIIVVPLSGGAIGDHRRPRPSRWSGGPTCSPVRPTSSTCRPAPSATLTSTDGGRYALCGAVSDADLPAHYGPVAEVPVELRGAGQSSRQVRNFGTPQSLAAGAIIACEVITPGGNWSSYPAHKHDEATETESELEEIYYFEIAAGPNGEPGLGFMRTSSSPGHDIDICEEVHDRDAVLVPFGWHGPCVAAPGLRHVLPERDGRPAEPRRRRAGLEDLRPPRPDLGAGHLGRPAGRPATHHDDAKGLLIMAAETVHLTVAQATVKFLSQQYSESDGVEYKFFEGCFGIFGHGNVAGLGQALLQAEIDEPGALPYVLGRNEQAMVHSAVAFARMRNRLQTYAVSSSVGPGATNMVTGAALATINRIPVLLLPADTFADRAASPLLQELELPYAGDVTVNDSVPSGQQVLRPDLAARAAARRADLGDAGADRPGRDRCGHRLLPAGRAGAVVRLAGRAVRQAGLARLPAAAGDRRSSSGRQRSSAARPSR